METLLSSGRAHAQPGRDVSGEQPRVGSDAVDEVRPADSLEPQADGVETRHFGDTGGLSDRAVLVEHWYVEPRILRGEPGRPDDAGDVLGAGVEQCGRRGHPQRLRAGRGRRARGVGTWV